MKIWLFWFLAGLVVAAARANQLDLLINYVKVNCIYMCSILYIFKSYNLLEHMVATLFFTTNPFFGLPRFYRIF